MAALQVVCLSFLMVFSSLKIQADTQKQESVDSLILNHERIVEDLAEFVLERPFIFFPLVGRKAWSLLEDHLETFLEIHTNSLVASHWELELWGYPKGLPLLRELYPSRSQFLGQAVPDLILPRIAKAHFEVNRNQIDSLTLLLTLNQNEKEILEEWVTALCFISSRLPGLSKNGRRIEEYILSAHSLSTPGNFRIESLSFVPSKAIASLDREYRSFNELPLEEQNLGMEFAAENVKTGLFVGLVYSARRQVQKSCRAVLGNK